MLVGSAPDDAKARALFYRKYGGEWRVNLYGDYWFPIMDVLGPYAYPIVFGASWAENWEEYNFNREYGLEDTSVLDVPVGMFADLWDTTTDFTFVRTLNHFAGKGTDVMEQIAYTAGGIAASFTPESALVRNTLRAIEAYGGGVQISERFENLPEAFMGSFYRSIGLNHGELPPRIDYRGRKVERVSSDKPELRALFEFMSAYRPNFDMLDRYDREMVKLALFKTVPQRTIRGYRLTDEEYETYATAYGEATDRAIRATVDDSNYGGLTTLQKRSAVERAIDRYREVARKRFIDTLSYEARKRMAEYKNEIPATSGWNSRRMTKDSIQNSDRNLQGDAPF